MSLNADLREFIELLNSRGIEYVIVGAHSLAFHARPRYTGDLDILVRPSPENAAKLVSLCAISALPIKSVLWRSVIVRGRSRALLDVDLIRCFILHLQTEHLSGWRLNREVLRKEYFLIFLETSSRNFRRTCWKQLFIDAYPSPDQITDSLFAKGRIRLSEL